MFKKSLIILSLITVFFVFGNGVVHARLLDKSVGNYDLQCGEVFACPEFLHGRVAFWIEVFGRWDTNTAIFHDKEQPQRVFATLQRENGCRGSKKGDSIDRQRKYLKRILLSTSEKVRLKQTLSADEQLMAKNFAPGDYAQIKKAANRIRCQSGNKDRFQTALENFHIYQSTILKALAEQGLSSEILYLPFVESAFNPKALSHVGAAGMWQIMPATGKSLGLLVTNSVDERYDPYSASYAAAAYFRESVDKLTATARKKGLQVTAKELNPFVITSYNYGVKGMQRGIKQVGLNYERLLNEYKSPSFQTAVKNFYASFLAARFVARNSAQFFGEVVQNNVQGRPSHNLVVLNRPTSVRRLVRSLNLDVDRLRALNPAIKRAAWDNKVLLARGYQLKLPVRTEGWASLVSKMDALPKEIEHSGYTRHRVRRGETACGIAEKYGASCRQLRKLNRLNRKATIYVGQKLKVPTRGGGGISVSQTGSGKSASPVSQTSTTRTARADFYVIRKGDTACKIAYRHGLSCDVFLSMNRLKRSSTLRIGQKVRVSKKVDWHIVRKGQTACSIANRYRVSCRDLLALNELTRRSTIYIGQRIRIPNRS